MKHLQERLTASNFLCRTGILGLLKSDNNKRQTAVVDISGLQSQLSLAAQNATLPVVVGSMRSTSAAEGIY